MIFIAIIILLASLILETRAILDTDKIKKLTEKVFPFVFGGRFIVIGREIIPEFICSASLAHHGLLGSVSQMKLFETDLSPVPAKHLASLASCVTGLTLIRNVSGGDLVSLMTSLKCEQLVINNQSLGKEETRALVQAMESGVENVVLGGEVTLDMEALTDYSGQGRCCMIMCIANNPDNNDASDRNVNDAPDRNIDELMTWARSRNWRIAQHEYNGFVIINRRFQCRCQCHDVNVTVSMSGTENCECSCAEQN